MPRHMILLALLCIAAGAPAVPPQPWPREQFVRWQPQWGTRSFTVDGVSVGRRACGDGRPVSEGCAAGDGYLVATVSAPGVTPATIEGGAGLGGYVGVGRLGADAPTPSLVMVTENGGTDDCGEIDVAVSDGRAFRPARLSVDPRDHGTLCGVPFDRLAWPRDLTGHGRAAFVLADMTLHCRFSSCAGSWHPLRVVAFDGARGVDVSADPALAQRNRRDMARARSACEHRVEEAQGACAGYAFDAARLGVLPQAWRVIAAQMRRGCRVRGSGVCSDIDRIPSTFSARLAAALAGASS